MSQVDPKVSAVITTHNRLELLKRAIDSVLGQTFKSLELIVVDDASTDGTKDYLESQHIRYIHIPKEESRGGNYARNLGVKAARGEYVAFLDDDDYWLPDKIEKQVELIERMDCELVHCGKRLEIVEGDNVRFVDCVPNPNHWGDMRKKILLTCCTATSSQIMVKRDALFDVGLFDETLKFWQDYELTVRLAQRKPFYFVNEPLCVYRVDRKDKGRLTNKYYDWRKAVDYIHEKHSALYAALNPIQKFQVWLVFLHDACGRSLRAGLKWRYYYYKLLFKVFKFPFLVVEYIQRHCLVRDSKKI